MIMSFILDGEAKNAKPINIKMTDMMDTVAVDERKGFKGY